MNERDEVQLREVVEADLAVFFEQEQDPEALSRSKFTPRERDAFMTHWATKVLGESTNLVRTVTVGGEPAGHVVSWWEQDKRFMGYWFGRRFWGRGIGTQALALFLEEEKVRPIFADPFTGNTGSVRLLEKSGFQHEGTVTHGEHEHAMLVLRG